MAGITYTKAPTAPAGGITIGDPVTGGNPDSVLYIDGANNLNNSANFRFDDVLLKFTTPDVNLVNDEINYTDGQLKSDGSGLLTNNFNNNSFVMSPLGFPTFLLAGVFTLEGVITIEQSFLISSPQARMGSSFLFGGSSLVAADWIGFQHFVFLSLISASVNYGAPSIVITPGLGFTITSINPLDDSVYNFIVFNSF
jgi:hypothetical protein